MSIANQRLFTPEKAVPDLVFYEPCIPGDTGNAMRLAAITGCTLHLIEPLGFDMEDKKLKRAGLDYHDLAHYKIHHNFNDFLEYVNHNNPDSKIYAFTSHTDKMMGDFKYSPADFLLFGPEPTGLPEEIMDNPRITSKIRIPMLPGVRSLNLAVSASVAIYDAWSQNGYLGAI
jgi:tRNA (cytidine/uridine-2'-O-)-methyltransferase